MMVSSRLFFGFIVQEAFASKLLFVPKDLESFIIQNEEPYLYKVSHEGNIYLGKYVKSELNLAELQLVETNIFSLLKKLIPDYDYESSELYLIPIIG